MNNDSELQKKTTIFKFSLGDYKSFHQNYNLKKFESKIAQSFKITSTPSSFELFLSDFPPPSSSSMIICSITIEKLLDLIENINLL